MMDGGWLHPPPVSATFFTVTVSGSNRKFNPGNYDPDVPLRLANTLATPATIKSPNAPDARTRSQFWSERRARMQSGGSISWWQYQPNQLSDEMEYRCDINLGSPLANDCSHIQWDQLGPPSDSVTISSGDVQFFHSSKPRRYLFSHRSLHRTFVYTDLKAEIMLYERLKVMQQTPATLQYTPSSPSSSAGTK